MIATLAMIQITIIIVAFAVHLAKADKSDNVIIIAR
jgi:hypothetical protein